MKNTKNWHDLEGWFDYEFLYDRIARQNKNSILVEVGSWLGKSVAYLATISESNNNNNKIYAVDTWDGLDSDYMEEAKKRHNKSSIYDIFKDNMDDCGFKNVVTPIISCSWEAAGKFEDESCDFIFIDADHTYESVKKDILAWYPKLKPNGTFAGHDIFASQIKQAATDGLAVFNKTWHQEGTCWIMS
jgi:predicted O-methyltransferase YrrM